MVSTWPYPAPADDGAAAHLVPGLHLPSIELPATRGPAVDLSLRPGRSVVFVYPWTGRAGVPNPPGWDDIAGAHGSTPQVEGFRDHFREFAALRTEIFGLSSQDGAWQGELAERLGLPFALLSDERFALADALRLPRFRAGSSSYLARVTLIVRDGVIERSLYPVHPPPESASQTLAALRER